MDLASGTTDRQGERLQNIASKMGRGAHLDLLRVQHRLHAWILNARRLNKDYEKNRRNSQSMVYLAMLPLMINRLK